MHITYHFNPDHKEISKSATFKDAGSYTGFINSLREVGFTDTEITLLTGISIPKVDKATETKISPSISSEETNKEKSPKVQKNLITPTQEINKSTPVKKTMFEILMERAEKQKTTKGSI